VVEAARPVPDEVDVVIIGAGAAGSLIASRLATGGRIVAVLDAGPAWDGGDLVSSQIWSRRLRWGGPPIATGGAQPIGFGFNAGWGFGGAALHHYGTWPRMHEVDFKLQSRYGKGIDWPIDYEDLRVHYDRVQEEVGISGDADAEIWRPPGAPYPMPPLQLTRQADAIARGFAALGQRTAPAPMAINSEEYRGRPACIYDGWCDAGCPIGALANPLIVHKPDAEAAGATFHSDAPVVRLLTSHQSRVDGVVYMSADGPRTIRARLVVLAASIAGNASLLLQSASDHHPGGIGNAHDLVGRYVMTHPAVGAFGLFDDDTQPHMGVTGALLIGHDNYRQGVEAGFQWLIAPSIKPNDLAGIAIARADLHGAALETFMQRAVRHIGNMVGMAEALPLSENRITLGSDVTSWGTRTTLVTHRHDGAALAAWQRMRDQGTALMDAAGAAESWTGQMFSAHLMGGTIMGSNPDKSVTDSYGRVHGIDNLYVAGASLFPTGGAVNPTFTLLALADRTAEHIMI